MFSLRDILVGNSRYRLGGLALYLSRLPSVRMTRGACMAWLKKNVAQQYPMSAPQRIQWGWASRFCRTRYLVHRNQIWHAYVDKPFPFSCPICAGLVETPRRKGDCFYNQNGGVCETCYAASRRRLYEIAGITECNRLRIALDKGEYTKAKKEPINMQTTSDLRNVLISDLEGLRAGTITRPEARCRAYVAKQIIDTVKVECVAMAGGYSSTTPLAISTPSPMAVAAE